MSKFKPCEDQIRSLINQGRTIKDVNDILISQGIDSNYAALHWFCRSQCIIPATKRKYAECKNMSLGELEREARKAGMHYGQYVGMLYSKSNCIGRKKRIKNEDETKKD